jgi:hypothetical protein
MFFLVYLSLFLNEFFELMNNNFHTLIGVNAFICASSQSIVASRICKSWDYQSAKSSFPGAGIPFLFPNLIDLSSELFPNPYSISGPVYCPDRR